MSACKTLIKKVKDVSEASALVLDWFERENKPATPQSLTDALGSRVAKTLIQKILDQLLADNRLCVKELKKIRFYYLRPREPTPEKSEDNAMACPLTESSVAQTTESQHLESEGTRVCAEVTDTAVLCDVGVAAASLAEKHCRLARWSGWPSRADRAAQRDALEREVQQLQVGIEALQRGLKTNGETGQSSQTRASRARRAVRRYRRARHLWAERKRWAMRLLEATGGDMHSPQRMAALLGCTTDNDAGISFESSTVALSVPLLRDIGLT